MTQTHLPGLEDVIKILPPSAPELVQQLHTAYEFATHVHGQRRRTSGELYTEHDVAVAYTLGELGLDGTTVLAGLLHDTLINDYVEGEKNRKKMEQLFGAKVTNVVVGLRKLEPYANLHEGNLDERQMEKLRRAILAAVDDDLRILFVRMADRLQNLFVAHQLPAERKLALAKETSEIYAPIANRLGMWSLKWQLEDNSFELLEPEVYHELVNKLDTHRPEREAQIEQMMALLQQKLDDAHIEAKVTGRPKHLYSIYRKMKRKRVSFEEIYDVRAVRVLIEKHDIGLCYQVLGLVHNLWLPIPEEFDDYIANPKPNGYKSLHTAVYDESGQPLEVQIRTQKMDDEAERGIAAHWSYKEGGRSSNDMKKWVEWLRKLLIDLRDESHEGTPDAERMINIDDLNKRIYVFTPRRDLIELPEGATPIDFAYQIHTELGHKCRGATVNGKIVPLNYELRPGDTVGIIKANRGGPSRDWMNDSLGYARSGKTRSKVRQWFREHDRQVNMTRGREMIERELKRLKLQDLIPLEELAQFFKQENLDDFLARVGFGDITFTQVTGTIALLQNQKKAELAALEPEEEVIPLPPMPQQEKQRKGLLIQGLSGLQHQMANCCQPVPPEPIIGYVTRGRGVSIHHKECDQFKKQAMKEPGRVIEVSWGIDKDNAFYEIPLVVQAFRAPELAESIATMVSGRQISIPRTKSVSDGRGLTTVYLVVTVKDLQDLEWFMQKVKHMSHVLEVKRQRW